MLFAYRGQIWGLYLKLQNFSFKNFICFFGFQILGLRNKYLFMADQVTKKSKKSIGDKWREVLESRGTKQTWLADQIGISQEHLSNILSDRVLITEENRKNINTVLGTDF